MSRARGRVEDRWKLRHPPEHVPARVHTRRSFARGRPDRADAPRDRPRSHAFSYADASLPTLGRRLSAELDVMDDLSPLVIEGLAADVVGRMWSRCRQERTTPSWLFKVRDRIESEYSSPPTLSEMAAMVHRTPSHVATAFRRVFGRSVGEYVRGVRLWRARTLLDDEATSLATIAQRTGFSDQSHFCRIFKRRFGLTPGAYRIRRCLLGRFDHDRPFVPQQ
jgi:AraC-like DNA-binding protein